MQDQIDYLMEFIDIQGEILEEKTGSRQPELSVEQKKSGWLTVVKNSMNFYWDRLKIPLLRQRL